MENEEKKEYIVTIDGIDCVGKTTLWKQANEFNKNIQIRGIVSNIAYAIKFDRNVDELIDLYNQTPINYIVYLINPINDKRLEMLYNRLRNNIYNDSYIAQELLDASTTWNDFKYFSLAIDKLQTSYKGELIVHEVKDNEFDNFKEYINGYNIKVIDETLETDNNGIKVISSTINNFEYDAKHVSEFKYIVLLNKIDKEEAMNKLYEELDTEHQQMIDNLLEYSHDSLSDVYDDLEEKTVEALTEYLDNYELRCEVTARVEVDGWTDVYIPLRELNYADGLDNWVYNDSCAMDDIIDGLKDNLDSADIDIEVERVY